MSSDRGSNITDLGSEQNVQYTNGAMNNDNKLFNMMVKVGFLLKSSRISGVDDVNILHPGLHIIFHFF